ncbi:linalool dehydratase/isomerase domain-containing protein [Pseudomonas sp. OTU5201]|uniref:linalool dehydratase/isomerase domain-containing protein n=1 Tax=Pseudomonas sp. OTU5201 TaxID=3043850 RepID=UPI00313CC02F
MNSHSSIQPLAISKSERAGPVSLKRQRLVSTLYFSAVILGLLPWLLDMSAFWQASGLGLWFPGAGFLAVGGWSLLLLPVTLLLFAVAVFAWFATGIVIAPPLVWVGSALLAGALSNETSWPWAPWLAAVACVAWQLRKHLKRRKQLAADLLRREQRNAYLPDAMQAVEARAVPHTAPADHELGADEVALSRLIFERALQPVGQLEHFDRIDQFQTASLRYQLNFLGYGLAQMQSQYTPNFHGYLSEAQRRLIEQYLERPIWDYWRLENLWGNLKYDPNPVGKDNVMLTGYLGQQVGMYMLNTGDHRYAEPGSLTFRWDDKTTYAHDIHSINRSLMWNFDNSRYCLFPCEPNWIYTGCNFFALRSVAVYDRLFGTHQLDDLRQPFLESFEREFTTASGSVVSLRSSLTGATAPFPGGDAGAVQGMNLLSVEHAKRFWAMARNDMGPLIVEQDGVRQMKIPGKGLDFGNYRRGFTMIYGGLLMQAREIGDSEFSSAILNALDLECGRKIENGVLSYQGSNLAQATAFLGRLMQRDGYRQSLMVGPPPEALRGPLLTDASFPDVLVAKARSHRGDDLELVLYPGKAPGVQRVTIERLRPHGSYTVTGSTLAHFTADEQGKAEIDVQLNGRTSVVITPDAG